MERRYVVTVYNGDIDNDTTVFLEEMKGTHMRQWANKQKL